MASTLDTVEEMEESNGISDRLKLLYPMVNEDESPLPRSWSPKDKFNYIGLSNGNLRVHYKGKGNFKFCTMFKKHKLNVYFSSYQN